jgi:hypothetical protein
MGRLDKSQTLQSFAYRFGTKHRTVFPINRRVDVSLNTTGQQSVRQYPFNAKDSLTC